MRSMTFWRVMLYAAASLLISIPATSQVNMEIPRSPAQHIRITRFADEPSSAWNPFPGPDLEPLHKAALTIHNDDDKEVVAVCVIWKITNTLDKTSTHTMMLDEYLATVRNAVIAPHGKLSVAPTGFISMPEEGMGVRAHHENYSRMANRLAEAKSATVSVDSIIYSDGTLWGPNTCGLDNQIAARKAAAIHVAQVARKAMAYNEDPANALKVFSHPSNDSHQAGWESRFAEQVLSNPAQTESVLQYLEALPSPPPIKPQPQQ